MRAGFGTLFAEVDQGDVMTDFAILLLTELRSAGTKSSAVDQAVLSQFGASTTDVVSQAQFQKAFAEMLLEQPTQTNAALAPTTFNVKKTIFDCMLYPSYSTNYATAEYQVAEMIATLDKNGDGNVSLSEMQIYSAGTQASTPSSGTDSSSANSSTSSTSSTQDGQGQSSASSWVPHRHRRRIPHRQSKIRPFLRLWQ